MKRKEILIILIPLFICVIAWISFNIYHSAITSTISEQELIQTAPINPDFDTKVLDELKKRDKIEVDFNNATNSSIINKPIPTPLPQPPTASESAQTSSESGSIDTGEELN